MNDSPVVMALIAIADNSIERSGSFCNEDAAAICQAVSGVTAALLALRETFADFAAACKPALAAFEAALVADAPTDAPTETGDAS